MDPDANLAEQRQIAARILARHTDDVRSRGRLRRGVEMSADDTDDAQRLAELVQALDGWISGGGFLPAAWRPQR